MSVVITCVDIVETYRNVSRTTGVFYIYIENDIYINAFISFYSIYVTLCLLKPKHFFESGGKKKM